MTEPAKAPYIATDDELLRQIQMAQATIDMCDRNKKAAIAELLARRKDEITTLLKAKDEPFGAVNIVVGNHKVCVTTPKKIDWDESQLEAIAKKMEAEKVDPRLYLKIEYSVSETVWKQWPKDMQDYFMPARTVKPGTVSLKVVEEKL